jgi:hypothetical protein
VLPATGKQPATPNVTAATLSGPPATDGAPPCEMPVRRPGADCDRSRASRAGRGAAADGDHARPPTASLQRVLDALRKLG